MVPIVRAGRVSNLHGTFTTTGTSDINVARLGGVEPPPRPDPVDLAGKKRV